MNIRKEVIEPVVEVLGGGHAAVELLYYTGLAESGYRVTKQVGGPALGYWQMEPETYADIWSNFLAHRPELRGDVLGLIGTEPVQASMDMLETNHRYACALARVHYLRVPAPLPPSGELASQAAYWKEYYNTVKGKGSVEHFLAAASGASHAQFA